MLLSKHQCVLKFSLLFLFQFGFGQNGVQEKIKKSDSKFSFGIATFNHAEQIYAGVMTYELTNNNFLIVSKKELLSNKVRVIFKKQLDENILIRLKNIPLQDLQEAYFNKCIMTTSGTEYIISITNGPINKTITLHHYYIREIEQFINEVNNCLSDDMKIRYMTSETKQDCN
ncbi:hypothetical protein OX284_010355 [Flavobacterium sp. SUN046]|uniref:hypothetical protein n=1 Tax=Flavobacterium sp. SUN046 TaxID=3002440 RepID=UPI002DB84DFE|nr:hypothetical protein [Flavobacterium sp. SUN046]MEC4049830.1 hypothetical protein [Flavobacterium sp. SUN046]